MSPRRRLASCIIAFNFASVFAASPAYFDSGRAIRINLVLLFQSYITLHIIPLARWYPTRAYDRDLRVYSRCNLHSHFGSIMETVENDFKSELFLVLLKKLIFKAIVNGYPDVGRFQIVNC
jgi:hypothetical protein